MNSLFFKKLSYIKQNVTNDICSITNLGKSFAGNIKLIHRLHFPSQGQL